jgi:hypothetical protein
MMNLLLLIAGIGGVVEGAITPGLQWFNIIIGGGMVGWSAADIWKNGVK